jgi:putative IMPACT (imprinted ancient) family translation regulator
MLEVFRRGGIVNVLCVVTRYFGGILLGAGGLTRAYAQTAKLALDAAGISEMQKRSCVETVLPYHLFERVKKEIELLGGTVEAVSYGESVTVTAHVSPDSVPVFRARLLDVSAGTVDCAVTGELFTAVPLE